MQALDHEVAEGGAVRRDGGGMLKPIHQHILFIKKSVGNLCAAGIDPNSVPHRYAPPRKLFPKIFYQTFAFVSILFTNESSIRFEQKSAVFCTIPPNAV